MDNKIQFAYAAIADIQATIRAIDIKLGALLTAVFLPISVIAKIYNVFMSFTNNFTQTYHTIAVIIFLVLWGLIVTAAFRTLAAVSNPKVHVSMPENYSGVFYCGGEYEFGFLDYWFNRKSIRSKSQINQLAIRYPKGEENVINELAFEHLKLAYIRDIKIHRLKFCMHTALIWGVIGLSIFVSTRI